MSNIYITLHTFKFSASSPQGKRSTFTSTELIYYLDRSQLLMITVQIHATVKFQSCYLVDVGRDLPSDRWASKSCWSWFCNVTRSTVCLQDSVILSFITVSVSNLQDKLFNTAFQR